MWLKRAFSMLEQEDVEVDLEQLDTLAKVGTAVQGDMQRDAVTAVNLFVQPLIALVGLWTAEAASGLRYWALMTWRAFNA